MKKPRPDNLDHVIWIGVEPMNSLKLCGVGLSRKARHVWDWTRTSISELSVQCSSLLNYIASRQQISFAECVFQVAALGRFELHVSWMRIRYTRPTIRKSLVGRGGNAPPKPEGNGFTARPVILSGTCQFLAENTGVAPVTHHRQWCMLLIVH